MTTRRLLAPVVLALVALVALGVYAGAAGAQTTITLPDGRPVLMPDGTPVTLPGSLSNRTERVTDMRVDMKIESTGTLLVNERITYDFGLHARHGIYRYVPVRYRYDDRYDRVYRVSDISVISADAPDTVARKDADGNMVLRIGDPNRTITGTHVYNIQYRLTGVLNGFPDHDELFWNVVGGGWQVPIEKVTATVTAPGPITRIRCVAGPRGLDSACPGQSVDGSQARFGATGLAAQDVMTIAVAFPKGLVPPPEPILEERWSLTRAFNISAATVTTSVLLGLLALGGLVALLWRGRDRRFTGSGVDVAYGNAAGTDQAVPLFERSDSPVEFVPPDGIRPGQLGTLIDEVAHPLDVVASIVDLAVRGYLRIEQLETKGFFRKPDWNLVALGQTTGELRPYETRLLKAIFDGRDQVKMSELKNHFASDLVKVENDLYQDVVEQGWFAMRPDRTRTRWRALATFALVVACGISALLIWKTKWALLAVPLVLFAIVFRIGAKHMPRRTARGTAMVRRVFGFRQLFTEPEIARQRYAEDHNMFSTYLPYAIVFGLTERWAQAAEGLGLDPATATGTWYASPHPFVWADFGHTMDSFTVNTAGTLVSTPPAASGGSGFSGGGFSGGGGGGGGGGSW